jgi:hypothetical protein
MPDTFIQQQNRLRQRRNQKNQGFVEGAVFQGVISGDHDSLNEQVGVAYHAGERKMQTLHPYVGADSWIRVGAEAGQPVLAAQRPDSTVPELLAYAAVDQKVRTDTYQDGVGLYRPLQPGEIEIHSKGTAQAYYGRRPRCEHRAGIVRSWLDQDRLESGARAPLHVRQCHLQKGGSLGDEERFGVVARPSAGTTVSKVKQEYVKADRVIDPVLAASVAASALAAGIVAEPGPWAKEHTRILYSGALLPEKLLDIREGDVIDDSGSVVNLSSSGQPLRYKGEWFTEGLLGGAFFIGIDKDGNFTVSAPDDASVGGDITIPSGDLILTLGKSHTCQIQTDYTLSTVDGSMTIDSKTGYQVTVGDGSITLLPSNTLDVGAADEPAVLGNQLTDFLSQFLDLFSQHFHTGNLGAPTPLDPGGLSQTTQLKAQFVDQGAIISDYINLSKRP